MARLNIPVAEPVAGPGGAGTATAASGSAIPIDIGALLDTGQWSRAQKGVLALIACAFIGDGLANQIMAVSIPSMICEWHRPRAAFASITAIGLVGITIGTLLGGAVGDRLGRRTTLGGVFVLMALGAGLAPWFDSYAMLAPARFVTGLGIGAAIPNATALIAEFTPVYRRGRAVNLGLMAIPIGILLTGLIGAWLLPSFGWQSLFWFVCGLSLVLAVVLFLAVPESPRYLLSRPHRRTELQRVLDRLGYAIPDDALLTDSAVRGFAAGYRALLNPMLARGALTIGTSFFFCFLGVYSVLNWIPTLLASRGFPLWAASASLSAWSVGGMLSSLVCAWGLERFGSRIALTGFAAAAALGAMALALLPLTPTAGIAATMLPLAGEGLLLSSLTGGLYALAAHGFPPNVRASGVGAVGAMGRAGAIASSFAAVAMMKLSGGRALFLFVAVVLVISGLLLLLVRSQIPRDTDIRRSGPHH